MKSQKARRETTTVIDDTVRVAVLTAALRILCIANQLQLQRQSMTVTRPPECDMPIDFTGAVPFGFAFTEGHEATFHVPSGHRYVIEQISTSNCVANEPEDVQLLTRSPHMFRQMTVASRTDHEKPDPGLSAPVVVNGPTANTLLFSNGESHSAAIVPAGTYVQLWGYLEPAYEAEVA